MTQDNFDRLIRAFLKRRPFTPFTIEFLGGSRLEVNHPEAIEFHGNGVISCQSTTGARSYFEGTDVVRFLSVTGTA